MISLARLNNPCVQNVQLEGENSGLTQTVMVTWAEHLDVVMLGIVTAGSRSHHVVWQIGTNILEAPAASSFSIYL
jgi:hypothetical protein